MTLIDARGRVLGRINLIDLMIALGVVIAVILAYATVTRQGKVISVPEDKVISYTILIKEVRPEVARYIKKGDLVKKQSNQAPIGTIRQVLVKPALVVDFNGVDKRIATTSPVEKDVYVTIKTKGRIGKDIIATGNEVIRVGDNFPIVTKWFTGNAVIIGISLEEDRHQE